MAVAMLFLVKYVSGGSIGFVEQVFIYLSVYFVIILPLLIPRLVHCTAFCGV